MAMDFAILEPAGAGTFHAPWKVIMAHMVSQHLVALNRFESAAGNSSISAPLPVAKQKEKHQKIFFLAGGWWQPPV